ncbi:MULTISPECIES: DUF2076 domain-containing protein [unclassified Saccharibacter]|uniref:DUF2076 domain-containing protein n=1 Tax=unclassified Saccharibacter TaxID=2648722 RepID=UPI001325B2B2|nr:MULTISPECIES: DUF2076 domain-containing protein [unclassified Saccharibacter]MXV36079.1 DUF2076 family protein [Saccharibacter sp. EH611]MXV56938.1 DUF2076 family protein [Saccharibacter sp. EH70]MXV66702.1 DUF2076 family protein [Saccharibacter sp. EH60]
MNSEERDVISRFIARVGGGQGSGGTPAAGNLPAIDPEADRFIAENFQQYPEARYRVTQLAVVQEAALAQAQNRIRELEMQLQQARTQLSQQQAQQSAPQSGGGFLSNMFGRSGAAQPQPQQRSSALPPGWGPAAGGGAPTAAAGNYAPAPGAQAGMFPRSGSGFLGSALTTAAGVAGGMMAANALEGLFSDHHGHEGGDAAGGFGADHGGDTYITNNYGDAAGDAAQQSDPFGGAGTDASGFTQQDFGGNDGFAQEDTGQDMGGGSFDDGGGFDDNSF